ncbi:protein EMBRYONIC FLOWER 1 [Sesamum alatum]|uniref:Protein EMBRYONIC FLOWER 1 n=1 Tax=Sesamum alatum TaxID=300844 RepID=A0AAE1Y1X5_9LAMI|nr:protein EMBRYONIC FLOWER 1 [Sesamum alatum]
MDKSIVAVDESHRRSDSLASASKSLGSLVQINSIAIDISCAMEEIESPAHEHFSIRGFVAGMRQKDRKMCLPFASEGDDDDDLVDNLPPLPVPRFRWWQCSNCVPDISAERPTLEMPLRDRSNAGTSSCRNIDGVKDGLFLHNIQNTGDEHRSRDAGDGTDDSPSNKIIKYNPWCTEGHKEATTSIKEKKNVGDNEGGNPCECITVANHFQIRERHNSTAADNPSARVEEPENASSGSDGAFSALPHRRKPKLRSLADIMEEEKNSTSDHPRVRSTSSSGMHVKSTETEADLDPQLQFDVPADVAKGSKSPQRKRKIGAPEEDRGSLEMTDAIATAKRSKGPIPEAEKTCRRVEISDSESERDAPTRLDLRLSARTQQIKPRKQKALDMSRKTRQNNIDNRTVTMREVPKINSVHSANVQKHAITAETGFCSAGHVPSALGGETGPYFGSFLSGQQMDRISNLSKSKRPEVEADPLMPTSKNILGDCNIQGKVALDLSLNSYMGAEINSNHQVSFRQPRGIPDLNESFTEKTSIAQGKLLPTLPENRSLTLHKNMEMSASCSKEMAREGRRQLGVPEPQVFQNMDNNLEPGGASDDIPMEIVELLAKNQRERALGNSRKHLLPEEINNSIRGPPPVYVDGRPGMTNFPFTNTRSGVTVGSGKMGVGQGVLNFHQVKIGQLDMGNLDESQFRLFSSFTPSQPRKTQYSATNSIVSAPRPSEGADLLWPPRRKNVPFHLSINQNHSVQSNGLGLHPFSDQRYKGKTISDTKGDGKKSLRDQSSIKEGRIGSNPKSVGSLDAYSNDTIPAMQLLSLMDRGIVSGSSFKVGTNGFLDKTFSPCNHHPRLNGNENQTDPFLGASFFSQSSHTKDYPGLPNGVCFSGESLKKSYLQGQTPPEQGNSKAVNLEGPSNLVTRPSRGNLSLGVCTLNRNPADFSIPDARNEFTISAKDLKSRRRNALKERSRLVNMEGQKRQRARKDASGKECPRK